MLHCLAGLYILGISRGFPVGGSPLTELAYQVAVEPTTALPPAADVEPNDDLASAGPVSGDFALSGDLEGSVDHFGWTLSADEAARLWALETRVPTGSAASLAIHGPDGQLLADATVDADGYARLHDLGLPAGTYDVVVSPAAAGGLPYLLSAAEVSSASADPEPNDVADRAVPLEPGITSVPGRLAAHADRDIFLLPVDAARAASQQDIVLVSSGGLSHQVCLAGVLVQCRSGVGEVRLSNLLLVPGDLLLEVTGEASLDDGYELQVRPVGAPSSGREIEPNDSATAAAPLAPDTLVTGRGDDSDTDFFQAVTTGEPQLWRLEADGTAIKDLDWVQLDGSPLAAGDVSADETHAVLRDLALDPGRHWFSIRSTGGDYALRLIPMGPPDPDGEREPNDDSTRTEALAVDQPRTGRLVMGRDVDVYRFSLAAREHVIIEFVPPADGAATLELRSDGTSLVSTTEPAIGEPVVHDLSLEAGDYEVWLRPDPVSESDYALAVRRQDPFLPVTGEVPPEAAVSLDITTTTPEIAAYWPSGQRVAAEAHAHQHGHPTRVDLPGCAHQPLRLVRCPGPGHCRRSRGRRGNRAGQRPGAGGLLGRCAGAGDGPSPRCHGRPTDHVLGTDAACPERCRGPRPGMARARCAAGRTGCRLAGTRCHAGRQVRPRHGRSVARRTGGVGLGSRDGHLWPAGHARRRPRRRRAPRRSRASCSTPSQAKGCWRTHRERSRSRCPTTA